MMTGDFYALFFSNENGDWIEIYERERLKFSKIAKTNLFHICKLIL